MIRQLHSSLPTAVHSRECGNPVGYDVKNWVPAFAGMIGNLFKKSKRLLVNDFNRNVSAIIIAGAVASCSSSPQTEQPIDPRPVSISAQSDFSYCKEAYRHEIIYYSTNELPKNNTTGVKTAVSNLLSAADFCSIISIRIDGYAGEEVSAGSLEAYAKDSSFLTWQELTSRGVSPNIITTELHTNIQLGDQKNHVSLLAELALILDNEAIDAYPLPYKNTP